MRNASRPLSPRSSGRTICPAVAGAEAGTIVTGAAGPLVLDRRPGVVSGQQHRRRRVDRGRDAQIAQRGLRDPLEDRRRHRAAVGRVRTARRVDDHQDRQRRLAGRHEADERHVEVGLGVVAVHELARRPGLASDGEVDERRARRRAVRDDAFHHRRQLGGGFRRGHSPDHLARNRRAPVAVDDGTHDPSASRARRRWPPPTPRPPSAAASR